jgi:hypothetical protein
MDSRKKTAGENRQEGKTAAKRDNRYSLASLVVTAVPETRGAERNREESSIL